MEAYDLAASLWHGLGWPLIRLIFFVSLGLLVANFIEALNWTHGMARLAAPLIRAGHLSDVTGASFSMAFFSGVSGNAMLAEAYDQEKIDRRELILANLFNSLPTYFLHIPTLFFITLPLIKGAAFVYVGLTFLAAFLRTVFILLVARFTLPEQPESCVTCQLADQKVKNWREAAAKAWQRFVKRIKHILIYTVPIYTVFYFLSRQGFFHMLERFLADHVSVLSWLNPESLSIVVFHIAAEFTAGLAAAGALLQAGTLEARDVVLALLVGNILSSPVRGVRHQFPYYAGIFNPRLAVQLIFYNQAFRAASMVLVTFGFYLA